MHRLINCISDSILTKFVEESLVDFEGVGFVNFCAAVCKNTYNCQNGCENLDCTKMQLLLHYGCKTVSEHKERSFRISSCMMHDGHSSVSQSFHRKPTPRQKLRQQNIRQHCSFVDVQDLCKGTTKITLYATSRLFFCIACLFEVDGTHNRNCRPNSTSLSIV